MDRMANQCALCDYSAITPRRLRHSVLQKIGRCAITPRLLRDDSAITPRVHISKTRSECNMRSTRGHAGNGDVCHSPIETQWILPTSRFKLTMLKLNGGWRLTQIYNLPVKILWGMGAFSSLHILRMRIMCPLLLQPLLLPLRTCACRIRVCIRFWLSGHNFRHAAVSARRLASTHTCMYSFWLSGHNFRHAAVSARSVAPTLLAGRTVRV